MIGLGTAINIGLIIAGGLCGLAFGRFMKENLKQTLMVVSGIIAVSYTHLIIRYSRWSWWFTHRSFNAYHSHKDDEADDGTKDDGHNACLLYTSN